MLGLRYYTDNINLNSYYFCFTDLAYNANPGVCLIINNMTFTNPSIIDLEVGKQDKDSLKVIFTSLGFDVKVHQNLTGQEEMASCVKSYRQKEHSGVFS